MLLQTMIQQLMKSLVKLIRGALLPFSLGENELRDYGGWEMKSELSGQWLAHVIQTVRYAYWCFHVRCACVCF